MSDVHAALAHGHPILGDVETLLSNLHIGTSGVDQTSVTQTSSESTPSQLAEDLSSHAAMIDRLRAHELVHLATTSLSLALTRRRSEDRLEDLLADEESDDADTSAFAAASGVVATPLSLEDPERFLTRAEYLLEREHEAVLNVRLNARTGDSRRRLGLALTAYIGMPLLLRSMLIGQIRFNRWEALTRKLKHLPLAHLRALDAFLAGLDPRYSLGQFLRHAASFLAQFETEPVLAARARADRDVWVEHLPDGLAVHCMKGPAPIIEAHHAATKGTASAIVRNQLKSMAITLVDRPEHAGNGDASEPDGLPRTGARPNSGDQLDAGEVLATGELPDLSDLSVADQRTIRQLMFDLLIGARPRTQTVVERVTAEGETTERYHVDVVCPDDATVLRKQATVVVTVPMTTLLGVDDRPGTIAGEPLPADMARAIAASSKTWYRMLTDPATGQVLDEVALKYTPDKATRLAVLGKWQTCTLPGCSRPAQECEIDHGVPFNHEHPELGGRTEPANLHPLCKSHHQAKTEGRIRMRRTGHDQVEWLLPLGTTATTVAPSVDDGGILTAACAPADTAERRKSRSAVEERLVRDPLTHRRTADAAFDQAGREFLAAERAREERQAARAKERVPLIEEQKRVRQWSEATTADLQNREDRVRDREAAACRRERTLARDERLASLQHSRAESQLAEAKRLSAAARHPSDQTQSTRRARFRTIIPMRTEEFDLGNGVTSSLHSPVFFGAEPLGDGVSKDHGLSAADKSMATAIHDAFARKQIVIDCSRVDQSLILKPPREPRPTDGFDDGEPPF